jgi:hypothetical protein
VTTTELIITLNVVIVAVVALQFVSGSAVRHAGPRRAPRADHDVVIRVARIASQTSATQSRGALRIAPLDSPRTALVLTLEREAEPIGLALGQMRSLRVWLHGRPAPVLLPGADLVTGAALRPLSPRIAEWELEAVTETGELFRCYGRELTPAAEADLARLRRLLAVRAKTETEAASTRTTPRRGSARRPVVAGP